MDLIDDLREAYKYVEDENLTLSLVFIQLAETKGVDHEGIKNAMDKLRTQTKKYWDYINSKIDSIIDE